jgi:hypothetical protein
MKENVIDKKMLSSRKETKEGTMFEKEQIAKCHPEAKIHVCK